MHAYALQILTMTPLQSHPKKPKPTTKIFCLSYRQSPCHTEALAEVSIKSKCDFSALRCILNSMDFSLTLKMTKCVFFVRHCERAKRAWQSMNLNANLPLDCHEFARLRFANSRNDKFLVILINSFALT